MIVSPPATLTYILVFAGILSSIAADAGYLVLIPLAAVAYQSVGRHPVAGLAAITLLSLLGWGLARYVPRVFSVLTGAPLRLRFPAPTAPSGPRGGEPMPVGARTGQAAK